MAPGAQACCRADARGVARVARRRAGSAVSTARDPQERSGRQAKTSAWPSRWTGGLTPTPPLRSAIPPAPAITGRFLPPRFHQRWYSGKHVAELAVFEHSALRGIIHHGASRQPSSANHPAGCRHLPPARWSCTVSGDHHEASAASHGVSMRAASRCYATWPKALGVAAVLAPRDCSPAMRRAGRLNVCAARAAQPSPPNGQVGNGYGQGEPASATGWPLACHSRQSKVRGWRLQSKDGASKPNGVPREQDGGATQAKGDQAKQTSNTLNSQPSRPYEFAKLLRWLARLLLPFSPFTSVPLPVLPNSSHVAQTRSAITVKAILRCKTSIMKLLQKSCYRCRAFTHLSSNHPPRLRNL